MPKKKSSNGEAQPQSMSKSDFVRGLPADMPANEVIAKAQEAGLSVSKNLVYLVRSKSSKTGAPKRRGRPARVGRRAIATRAAAAAGTFETKFADIVAEIGLARAEQLLRSVRAKFSAAAM